MLETDRVQPRHFDKAADRVTSHSQRVSVTTSRGNAALRLRQRHAASDVYTPPSPTPTTTLGATRLRSASEIRCESVAREKYCKWQIVARDRSLRFALTSRSVKAPIRIDQMEERAPSPRFRSVSGKSEMSRSRPSTKRKCERWSDWLKVGKNRTYQNGATSKKLQRLQRKR